MDDYSNKSKDTSNGSKAVKTAAQIAKKVAKTSKKGLALALDGLAYQTMFCLVCVLGMVFLISLIMSVVPSGILLKNSSDVAEMENNVESAVSVSYLNAKKDTKSDVVNYVNEKYGCDASKSDVVDGDNGSYTVSTDSCEINVYFTPNVNEIVGNISAYATAVNGTIEYLDEKTDIYHPEEQMFKTDSNGELALTDYGWNVYKENSNEYTDSGSAAFAEIINENSSTFFVGEKETKRWDEWDFYMGNKSKEVDKCYLSYDNPDTNTSFSYEITCSEQLRSEYENLKYYTYEKRKETIQIPAQYGKITIPIYYDLSQYKDEELQDGINYVEEQTKDSYMESASFVNSLLNEYYNNYYELLKNGESDNRNTYFQKLINDGVIMYVPISGLSSSFIQGEPGYAGEIQVNGMDGTAIQIWNKIGNLRKQGVLSTYASRYNCTEFANYWFYCVYGEGFVLRGDGNEMVTNLLNSDYGKEHFYQGSSPAPGAIYSIGSPNSEHGHVGCVDAVDFENQIITISEGNYGGGASGTINTGIRIRKTMTFDEFYRYVRNTGGSQSSWVMFANPKQ